MQRLRLLLAGTSALPGEHGARETRPARGVARRGQAAVPVREQGAGNVREVQGDVGQDEELVPEDVPPVGLSVQSPGRHAHVELGGERGERLEEMEGVQAQDAPRLSGNFQLPIGPESFPSSLMRGEQYGKTRCSRRMVDGPLQGLCCGPVERRPQGGGLHHHDGSSPGDRQPERLDCGRAGAGHRHGAEGARGDAYGESDPDPGRGRRTAQPCDVFRLDTDVVVGEMAAGEVAVALDTGIRDGSVEDRFDHEGAAPAVGVEDGALRGQVRVAHVNEPRVRDTQPTAVRVLEEHAARQSATAQVEETLPWRKVESSGVSQSPGGPPSGRQR